MTERVPTRTTPEVSIVVPTYNRARWVREAVESALGIPFRHLEVIVVDDGSTDNTREVVGKFGDWVQYHYQDNAGLGAARDRGLQLAKGQFLCFLDSDDLILPDKFDHQLPYFETTPADAVYSRWSYIDEDGNVLAAEDGIDFTETLLQSLSISNFAPIHSYVFRTEALRAAGGVSRDLVGCGYEDWDLLLRLAATGTPFAFCPAVTAVYRMHVSSMCLSRVEEMLACGLDVIDRFLHHPRHPPFPDEHWRLARAMVHLEAACQLYRQGEVSNARRLFCTAIELHPALLESDLLFGYFIGFLSLLELGHAAYAVNQNMDERTLCGFFDKVWDDWLDRVPPDLNREASVGAFRRWLASRHAEL